MFLGSVRSRALESLSPEGASVKEIFDNVWLHNRAFILARSREGDTEASRRSSTKNTIVNYLSTSPAFESIGRNRWVLTGKRHGADKRGGKISRASKRRPRNSSSDEHGGGSAVASASSNSPSSSSSAGNSSSSSPEITNLPPRRERPATTPLPLSNGLLQGPTQASSSSTSSVLHHTHDPQSHQQHQPQHRHVRQEGPVVSSLSAHAAPLNPGTSCPETVITRDNNNHPQRESFSYGQSAQHSTNANLAPAAPTGSGTRRSFDAVPQFLPRPPRTWHQDMLDPFATPIQTPTTSSIIPPCAAPSGRLFQIPSNMSYYEAPNIPDSADAAPAAPPAPASYMTTRASATTILPPPSISSSFCPQSTIEELFAQVDPQGGCAGNSIPVPQQHYPGQLHHHQHHQQQAQSFHDHDPFAAPPGFV
ncbi:hypothetical protein FRC04_009354 [Tulasnella sp. 424]|nr:hypothetical protein FRC04_009354 [Tulasnella sp. 424]